RTHGVGPVNVHEQMSTLYATLPQTAPAAQVHNSSPPLTHGICHHDCERLATGQDLELEPACILLFADRLTDRSSESREERGAECCMLWTATTSTGRSPTHVLDSSKAADWIQYHFHSSD
ncbi:hypothetical protein THAOC_32515, partial [Thalassiosira oceanica]